MRSLNPLYHTTLNATLQPKSYDTHSSNGKSIRVHQFRNLQFGYIEKRFDHASPVDDYRGKTIDCTRYGPRCPQNHVDVGSLLRIPKSVRPDVPETEDEFECLNLVVTIPEEPACDPQTKLPVVIWIHGGSQTVSFVSAASEVCGKVLCHRYP
jgi:carboxylesterase type B